MPRWDYTVNLRDVFYNDDLLFEAKRDVIVKRLKASRWYSDEGEGSVLHSIVEDLSKAYDFDSFNEPWSELYDEADMDRCWIAIL